MDIKRIVNEFLIERALLEHKSNEEIDDFVEIKQNTIKEDLAVWFGKKKKKKGIKPPKGSWGNYC